MSAQPVEPVAAYAWPPLPIDDPEVAAAIMAARLGAAWDDLEAERLRVITSAALGRKDLVDVFLREFQDSIVTFLAGVEGDVTRFVELHLGPRYQAGAETAQGPMSWTQPHVQALTTLATDTYADFLARAFEAQRVSAAFVRAVRSASSAEIPKIAAGGRTANQVADRLEERLLTRYGIDHVTYRDGARVPVRVWARMAARTKSAVSYNAGTLNGCQEAGVAFVEVFDGPSCGWRHHDDEDKAARSFRTIVDAGRYAISHPNCRRAFGARPDLLTQADADAATPSVSDEQHADAVDQERLVAERAPRVRAAAARRARLAAKRQARQLGATSTDEVAAIVRAIRADVGIFTGNP